MTATGRRAGRAGWRERQGPARCRRPGRAGCRRPGRAGWRERGSASLEFLGVLPILLLVALAGVQLGLIAYTASQAGTAARAAARMEALHDPPTTGQAAASNAVSDWLTVNVALSHPDADSVKATATIQIPSLFPGLSPGNVSRSATMPMEDTTP